MGFRVQVVCGFELDLILSHRVSSCYFYFILSDPFHLNFRACAMDWCTRFARSRGNASAGLLTENITVFP